VIGRPTYGLLENPIIEPENMRDPSKRNAAAHQLHHVPEEPPALVAVPLVVHSRLRWDVTVKRLQFPELLVRDRYARATLPSKLTHLCPLPLSHRSAQ
jgi:hypothetical protein